MTLEIVRCFAFVLVGLFAAAVTLLGRTILIPISEVGSFTCAIGWLATCLSFCCGAGGTLKWLDLVLGFIAVAVALSFMAIVANDFGPYEWLALGGWTVLGTGLWFRQRRLETPAVEG